MNENGWKQVNSVKKKNHCKQLKNWSTVKIGETGKKVWKWFNFENNWKWLKAVGNCEKGWKQWKSLKII